MVSAVSWTANWALAVTGHLDWSQWVMVIVTPVQCSTEMTKTLARKEQEPEPEDCSHNKSRKEERLGMECPAYKVGVMLPSL